MNSKVTMVVRILLGAMMLAFGLDKFFHFMPMTPPDNDMGTLLGLLFKSKFLIVLGLIESIGGLLLILGKYVPLAVTFIIADVFTATLFHIFYDDPANGMVAYLALVLGLVTVYANKDRFKELFSA